MSKTHVSGIKNVSLSACAQVLTATLQVAVYVVGMQGFCRNFQQSILSLEIRLQRDRDLMLKGMTGLGRGLSMLHGRATNMWVVMVLIASYYY